MQVAREMKKPIEDMQLADHKSVPDLKRIKGVKLAGEALADAMMVIEFLNNFGIALGFGKRKAFSDQCTVCSVSARISKGQGAVSAKKGNWRRSTENH
jgi:hypothetical protein